MNEKASNRRWLRFRVSSLLWLMTAVGLLFFAFSERRARLEAEQQNQAFIDNAINEYPKRQELIRQLDREIEAKMSVLTGNHK